LAGSSRGKVAVEEEILITAGDPIFTRERMTANHCVDSHQPECAGTATLRSVWTVELIDSLLVDNGMTAMVTMDWKQTM
jgi:hypothetical protein